MSDLPSRAPRPSVQLLVVAIALFGGAGAGIAIARWAAPASAVAEVVSLVVLPMVLVAGFHSWLGVAVIVMLYRFARRRSRPAFVSSRDRIVVPPGAWTFFPIGAALGIVGGVAVGVLFAEVGVVRTVAAYSLAGTGYGVLLWQCARNGYLPFPESD